jgi:hypothetical protein
MLRLSSNLVAMGLGLAICATAQAGPGRSYGSYHGSSSPHTSYGYSSGRYTNYRSSHYSPSYSHSSYRYYGSRNYYSRPYGYSSYRYANYNVKYGTKFSYGYYYPGRYHNHWSNYCWSGSYGCNLYYDPCCSNWYYWCTPASCYYPVSYCPYGTYSWSTAATPEAPVGPSNESAEPVESEQEQPPLPPPVKKTKVVSGTSEDLPPDVDGPSNPSLRASTKPTIKKGKALVTPPKSSDNHELHHDDDAVK